MNNSTNRPVVGLTTSTFAVHDDSPLALLDKAGLAYKKNPAGRKLTPTETVDMLRGAIGVVAGTESLDADVLSRLPDLRVISRCGAGMDNVDLDAARELGITVVNTPFGPTRATAELTVAMLMALLREIPAMDRDIRSGTWKKRTGRLLLGKNVGVIGYGRIGKATASLLQTLGCTVNFYDPHIAEDDPNGPKRMGLSDLLAWAEVITLHCNEPENACPLLGELELGGMREGAWLVNCARGSLVDETALLKNLASGHLSGAALDTYPEEPYAGPLIELDNVILTPHVGSYALEGRIQMEVDAVQNLIDALEVSKQ